MRFLKKIIIICFTLTFAASPAFAGVGLNQTRIVIDGSRNSASIVATNNSDSPFLVANYITEKLNSEPVNASVFIITPQVFKLEGNSSNTIKIQSIPSKFPADRESMYYFHSRNVPATDGKPGMKVGLENIIKVFYRPSSLTMSSKDAYSALDIKLDSEGIRVNNNSPYYINLNKLQVGSNYIKLDAETSIIPPFFEKTFPTMSKTGLVKWFVINELGGIDEYSKSL